ncbi:hypothetical protein [Tuwongella immobilis]|uniref:Uncharacterized protein n=1 Tax=Tuwongella immobilis TaxID=692036 RepID=A0A6C2YK64_9BACT|nr:hypothetical protein [Tuwongella immobilis]VIP01493.1 Uncharacterized protein OS=Rhodopirellula maiorica SM1 GN=RMSM_03795 PE=4 SV=1 [Tuwongella immobilis]VTR98571.1 Uncharacterized protein OS=Rhodopirellula maiorica SM1 GN=RMSM_03795 PE=4 SV=1 [Tuwongella immobilis]
MGPFIRVQSPRFRILPGEADELVNEGMYGKAVAEYLSERLPTRGYQVPYFGCEDWGWWVELAGYPFPFGVCIYANELPSGQLDCYVTDGATAARRWSWRKLQFIDCTAAVLRLHGDLVAIFRDDPDVQILAIDLDAPFVEAPSE